MHLRIKPVVGTLIALALPFSATNAVEGPDTMEKAKAETAGVWTARAPHANRSRGCPLRSATAIIQPPLVLRRGE